MMVSDEITFSPLKNQIWTNREILDVHGQKIKRFLLIKLPFKKLVNIKIDMIQNDEFLLNKLMFRFLVLVDFLIRYK